MLVDRLVTLADQSIPETLHVALETLVVVIQASETLVSIHNALLLASSITGSVSNLDGANNAIYTAGSALAVLKTLLRHSFAFCGTKSSGTGATRVTQEVGAQGIQQTFEALVVVLGAVEDEKVLTAGS
ncbi:hypothetical protein PsorP6_012398 [Peronosclerospora sorghi]|uniref:Uncharacterized protein n=1 Tax=Peronosclerospora sorghi TaxID=230839 RepID=A0ACC0WGB0_9STRA|nr:hypothetical protein PsorP6_012398 [Peronosclerospora sorghi]